MKKFILGGLAAAATAATLIAPSTAMAGNPGGGTTKCEGVLTAEVDNNLVVPAGKTCSLWGAQEIKGNVTVEPEATLESYQQTTFDGNVTVNGGTFKVLNRPVTIKKNLTITNSTNDVNGFWNVYDGVPSTIGGNFNYTNNAAPLYVGGLGVEVTGSYTYANNVPGPDGWTSALHVLGSSNIS